jgi:hypothetical protein
MLWSFGLQAYDIPNLLSNEKRPFVDKMKKKFYNFGNFYNKVLSINKSFEVSFLNRN